MSLNRKATSVRDVRYCLHHLPKVLIQQVSQGHAHNGVETAPLVTNTLAHLAKHPQNGLPESTQYALHLVDNSLRRVFLERSFHKLLLTDRS